MKDRFKIDTIFSKLLNLGLSEVIFLLNKERVFSESHLNGKHYNEYEVRKYYDFCGEVSFFVGTGGRPATMDKSYIDTYLIPIAKSLINKGDLMESSLTSLQSQD